tara:strand:- start:4016 stop:5626 length:1611 start_codon:yes stop_codon:yes gene_type:complete
MASPFITGLFGGAAKGLDVGLQKHLGRVEDNFDKRMIEILKNASARKLKHEDKSDKAEEALQLISGLTPDGNLRTAAEVIRKIGGVTQAPEFFKRFTSALATNKDLTLAKVVPFMESKHGTMTMEQAMNQVRKPFNFEVPAALGEATQKDNLFSRLFGPNYAKQRETIGKELTARGLSNSEAVQLAKMRDGKVNWGMVASPEERLAERHARGTVETLEQNLTRGERQITLLDEQIKNEPKKFRMEQAAHNERMLSSELDRRDKKARLAIFERENTAEHSMLARRKLVADIIASESGRDAEEHWNLLDSRELFYKDAMRRATPGTVKSSQIEEWKMQIEDIKKSKLALTQTMAADASTIYSKDSPKGIFKDKLQATINSIEGLKYADSLAGMIQNMTAGQAPMVLAAYQQHAKEMRHIYANNPHEGIQYQLKIADSNAKLAENMIFKRAWDNKKAAKTEPKPLYVVVDGKVQLDDGGYAKYNPDVKIGDRVIINDPYILRIRQGQGYHSPEAIKYPRTFLGFRAAGSKSSPFPEANR